ncbi:hypothetical protein V8C34DRAFT_293236 [Trichoderma compactum]
MHTPRQLFCLVVSYLYLCIKPLVADPALDDLHIGNFEMCRQCLYHGLPHIIISWWKGALFVVTGPNLLLAIGATVLQAN